MRFIPFAALLTSALLVAPLAGQEVSNAPAVVLTGVPFEVSVRGGEESSVWYEVRTATGTTLAAGTVEGGAEATVHGLSVTSSEAFPLTVLIGETSHEVNATVTPGWFSVLPPLVAIILALIFREVVTALFAGVWVGALAVAGFNPIAATGRLIDTFVVPAIADSDHASIMVFTLLLGAMVGLVARNGGTLGIVDAVSPWARSPRRGKLATWAAGMAIFFDDYANTLIVGNTMRPITDRLRISREKLAYLVDSTAAPVAALVPISTWVGYEISLIGDGLQIAAEQSPASAEVLGALNPFSLFVATIPYLFYPLLAIVFVFMTSAFERDFGPMATAERRAARGDGLFRDGATLPTDTTSEEMQPKEGAPQRWWNAGIPVLTVIVVVLVGLYTSGRADVGPDAPLRDVFGAAASYKALLWGSLGGVLMAMALSIGQGILSLTECIDSAVGGMKAMLIAMVILTLAWSLGAITEAVGTSSFLAMLLSERVAVELLPLMIFITSAAMAFATGTSWGTMAIMLPVVIPLIVALGGPEILPGGGGHPVFLGGIASVLAGSIFGDHCSPISDTTILSSTASACDHVDHVRTQLPYALLVAGVAMALGNVATAYGFPVWIALGVGVVLLFGVLRTAGTRIETSA